MNAACRIKPDAPSPCSGKVGKGVENIEFNQLLVKYAPNDIGIIHTQPNVEQRRARPLLGTLVEISATGASEMRVQAALAQAFQVVATVHALMSYHDADSDISRINRAAYSTEISVHEHTWRVLSAARKISEASNGLFDITIAPILSKLGFLPQHADFPCASADSNWRHLHLLPGNRVRLLHRLHIDVSGIAKGYAVDLAVQALQDAGMTAGRVNAGGDLRVFGDAAQSIQVRHPLAPSQHLKLLELNEGAVATSAGYYSNRRYQGRMITPLIHPHTRAACGIERSVTVLASDCMTADALTKVVHADPVQAGAVLARFNARALMLEPDAQGDGVRLFDTAMQNSAQGQAGQTESVPHA